MSAKLQDLLKQFKDLEQQIQEELSKQKQVDIYKKISRIKYFPKSDDITKEFNSDKQFYLLTITFDSKITLHLDEYGQKKKLEDCITFLNLYEHYTCFEKHKNGILHSHSLISCDHHEIQETLHKIKKIVTKSIRLEPAINIKPVKHNKVDLQRSYNYIVDDKPDHPKYKHYIFNI